MVSSRGAAIVWSVGTPSYVPSADRQHRHRGLITHLLTGEGLRHGHAAAGLNRGMQLAPFQGQLGAMFRPQPLPRPVNRWAILNDIFGMW